MRNFKPRQKLGASITKTGAMTRKITKAVDPNLYNPEDFKVFDEKADTMYTFNKKTQYYKCSVYVLSFRVL